jgi:hypothetical protein
MKCFIVVVLVVAVATVLSAGSPGEGTKSTPQFDKLKTLAGTWKGKDSEGKPITISYKLVSSGSVLMEELTMEEHPDAMITMYHLNGTKLMLTHYCSMGNQPRMRVEKASKDGSTLTFSYVDATNLSSPKDPHMSGLVVRFKDDDHFSQQWIMSMNGKKKQHETFDFERVK